MSFDVSRYKAMNITSMQSQNEIIKIFCFESTLLSLFYGRIIIWSGFQILMIEILISYNGWVVFYTMCVLPELYKSNWCDIGDTQSSSLKDSIKFI